jgi:hypothetical protein
MGPTTPEQGHVEAVDHVWFESPARWRVDAESGPGAVLVNIHDGDRAFRNFRFEDLGERYGRGVYLGGPQTYRQVMGSRTCSSQRCGWSPTKQSMLPVKKGSEFTPGLD